MKYKDLWKKHFIIQNFTNSAFTDKKFIKNEVTMTNKFYTILTQKCRDLNVTI